MSRKFSLIEVLGGLFLILFIFRFFSPAVLSPFISWFNGIKYCIIMTLLPFLFIRRRLSTPSLLFKKNIYVYVLLAVTNIITCYLFRGQPIWVSYWMWLPFFFIIYYPVFLSWKKPVEYWETILLLVFLYFLICYILQFLFIEKQLFVLDTDFERLEYETRIRLYSDSILYLGTFFCFNKFSTTKKGGYLLLFLIGSVCVFLQGFRMLILCYIIVLSLMTAKLFKFSLRFVIVFILLFSTLFYGFNTKVIQEKIEEISNRQETATFDNDNYVRVLLVNYYYNEHFLNNTEMILGSGIPHLVAKDPQKAESEYSRQCSERGDMFHYYPYDMGLLGLSWNAGIPFVICFIVLLLRIFRLKLPNAYLYIGSWELFILIVGLTNEISFNHANILYQAIVLTIATQIIRVPNNKLVTVKQNNEDRNIDVAI